MNTVVPHDGHVAVEGSLVSECERVVAVIESADLAVCVDFKYRDDRNFSFDES